MKKIILLLFLSCSWASAGWIPPRTCEDRNTRINFDDLSIRVLDLYSPQYIYAKKTFTKEVTISSNCYVSGNVGIGTTSPTTKLDVHGGDITLNNGSNDVGISFFGSADESRAGIARINSTDTLQIWSAGNVSAPEIKLYNGVFISHGTTASAANCYIDATTGLISRSTSSRKYKKNIVDLDIPLSKIMKLRPVSYYSKNENDKNKHIGLIAEEVAEIIPEIVEYKDGEPESIQYSLLSVLLLEKIKDLQKQIDELKKGVGK
jgi:hypothetical protein